jgi:hypothetical protein
VLGPWINTRGVNLFTGAVIAVLVMLSIILTASVLYPEISGATIVGILVAGSALALTASAVGCAFQRCRGDPAGQPVDRAPRNSWRMPPLGEIPPARLALAARIWMIVLRFYLVVAAGFVLVRIVQL